MNVVELVCVVFVAICVSKNDAATESQRSAVHAKFLRTGLECFKDYPLQLDHIAALRNRKFPEDETAKCFINCLYKKIGIIDSNGKISEDKIKRTAKQFVKDGDDSLKKLDELLKKCDHVNEQDTNGKGCERASLATKCFMEHADEFGLEIPI